eukprot:1385141-Amorphochlora_amoeboformis.AAC.1
MNRILGSNVVAARRGTNLGLRPKPSTRLSSRSIVDVSQVYRMCTCWMVYVLQMLSRKLVHSSVLFMLCVRRQWGKRADPAAGRSIQSVSGREHTRAGGMQLRERWR